MIDRATVEKITSTADIVEVVGDYVHLIRRGSNYMGLCPFHNERTPSFSVNKARNFCYCFSCKKGGSPVNFIMEKEGLNYHEALLHLAKKYNIEVVEKELTDEERARQSAREAMFVANEWAMRKMESDMHSTEEGRETGLGYLTERGVTDQAMKAFHLGYALDKGQHLTEAAKREGFDLQVMKTLGLVGTSKSGTDYDRFRGRVIFPVFSVSGKVVAFGGRDLKGGLAKYINSPESELYKKSNELYGMFQAKSAINREDKCFLVEGYMDVIGMWQSGLKNVVASSGTALTDGQIAMIQRFTNNITLIYDGDAAGIKAALRGIDMLLRRNMKVKVLLLPDGHDPDSFARKHTPEQFREYVSRHETDIISFKAGVMLNEIKDDPQKRISAINSVVESIAQIPDNVSRDVYIQECSMTLNIAEATIAKSVAKKRAEIVEAEKRARLKRQIGEEPESTGGEAANREPATPETDATQATSATAGNSAAGTGNSPQESEKVPLQPRLQAEPRTGLKDKNREIANNPLYPLEKEVLRLCVRYAFLEFCSYEEPVEEGSSQLNSVKLDVLQYVEEELKDSDMWFSVGLFDRMFSMLNDMRSEFEGLLRERGAEIDLRLDEKRRRRYDEIGQASLSVDEIKREEQKLESELAKERSDYLRSFTKEYPGRLLCSDADEKVRWLALELVMDRHQLSNIYIKDGHAESEEERLSVLLVRSIDEWKNEIINVRIKELFGKFQEATLAGDIKLQGSIQHELHELMSIRKEMSKYIGDRTIYS